MIYKFFCSFNSGITNSLGLFTLYDVTVSADTTFTATYSSVSATCTVEKCLFVDYGVTGKSNLTNMYYQGETTVTTSGTLFEPNSSNRWTIRPNAFGLFNTPIVIEFTIVSTSHRFVMQGFDSNTTQVFSIDTSTNMQDGDFVRIEIGSTEAKFYRNGSQLGDSWTYSSTSSMKFQLFFNQANTYLKYKDFRIK